MTIIEKDPNDSNEKIEVKSWTLNTKKLTFQWKVKTGDIFGISSDVIEE